MTIKLSHLKAAACIAPDKDIRRYMNGVWVLHDRVVATNGHSMLIVKSDTGVDRPYFIPLSVIKDLKEDVISISATDKVTTLMTATRTYAFNAEHSHTMFTENSYLRVVPASVSGKQAQFDPALLMDFVKAAKHLGAKNSFPLLAHNGDNAALVTLEDLPDVLGIVMPRRPSSDVLQKPQGWVK